MPSAKDREIRELLDELAGTPRGAELADPERYRDRIYRELADSDDPVLREIGEQLRDGLVRPHQLLAIPAYTELLNRGLDNLRQLDPQAIRAALVEYLETHQPGGDLQR